jgi:hypothetical protein
MAYKRILLSWLTALTLVAASLHLHVSYSHGWFYLDSSIRFDLSTRSAPGLLYSPHAPRAIHVWFS